MTAVCLYTCSYNPSGMGAHMLALAEQYADQGLSTSVMYWPAERTEAMLSRAQELGAELIRTPHPRDPAYGDEVEAALRERRVEVFHGHVGTGREDFGGARAARRAGVPVVVQTLHLPWMLRGRYQRREFHRSIREVDRLITVSGAQRSTYLRIGVPPELVTTVANGVPPLGAGPGRAEARRRLGLDPHQPVLLTVGRLIVMKGHRYLVDALPQLRSRFPELAAVVIGEGHTVGELVERAEAAGVGEALRLPGHRDDARELLDAADVFVLPSLHEGMPLVLLEAMAAGVPVVATRVVGTTEVVQDGVTGLLVPPADPGALAVALEKVLEDPTLRASLAQAGAAAYRSRFTARRMALDTLAIYDEVGR